MPEERREKRLSIWAVGQIRGLTGNGVVGKLAEVAMSAILAVARELIQKEVAAVAAVLNALDDRFHAAVESISRSGTRVVVTGVGRSGCLARQIAAAFVRTGMPSVFLHPTDAIHGDLGIVGAGDVVLMVSRSGRTEELLRLLPHLRGCCRSTMAIVGDVGTPLARQADLAIELATPRGPGAANASACSLAMLAVADALALTVMRRRAVNEELLTRNHPAGAGATELRNGGQARTGNRSEAAAADLGEVPR